MQSIFKWILVNAENMEIKKLSNNNQKQNRKVCMYLTGQIYIQESLQHN